VDPYHRALRDLEARGFGIRADLERIRALAAHLDSPQLAYPTIHIAGTNGKTTTARIVGAVLGAHGLTSGVYTSPHLQSVRERYLLTGLSDEGFSGDIISPDAFGAVYDYLLPFVEIVEKERGEALTYFEMTTAVAFEWMTQQSVGTGVFECGMGGLWDATNVVDPRVAVITPIAIDHTGFLGDTIERIASEKVGIIVNPSPVITSEQEPVVARMVAEAAAATGATVISEGEDFGLDADAPAVGGRLVSVSGTKATYRDLFLPLFGSHQARNLALAVASCEMFLDRRLDDEALRAGAAAVTSPGRLEVVGHEPLVVLDGAHNPHAAGALGPALEESFGSGRRTFVISIFEDKDIEGFLDPLLPYADRLIFTRHSSPRKVADPAQLQEYASDKGADAEAIVPLPEAVSAAISASLDDESVVVTGSIWAVGEAREHLLGPVP
jgi:dihydrofolate synthase/folylpolyglutamate synthase